MKADHDNIRSIRAFQLGWFLLAVHTGQARNPLAVEAQINAHASVLGLILPVGWADTITSNNPDQFASGWRKLVAVLRVQFADRNSLELRYFDAGHELPVTAARGQYTKVRNGLASLQLPAGLAEPQEDAANWLNKIHAYFNEVIRASASYSDHL